MGNNLGMSREELEETRFSEEDIKELHEKFRALDVDGSGTLNLSEFLAIPNLENNPLVRRVVASLDVDKNGEVDFKEFIQSLSVFTKREKQEKYEFTFRVYDDDGDGFISNADLFRVLKAMVGTNLSDTQLQQLVDRTIIAGDKDKDGKLSLEEFIDMIDRNLVESKMILDFGSGDAPKDAPAPRPQAVPQQQQQSRPNPNQ